MDQYSLMTNPQFQEFLEAVRDHVEASKPDASRCREALEAERGRLERQRTGWLRKMADPNLPEVIYSTLKVEMAKGLDRITEIDNELSRLAVDTERRKTAVDAEMVAKRIVNLHDVLAAGHCSVGNVYLAQHIEGIYCDANGQIRIRWCKQGVLGEAFEMPTDNVRLENADVERPLPAFRERRLTRRDLDDVIDDDDVADALNEFAVNPGRFDGLGSEWFSEDVFQFQQPQRVGWAEEHALEVAEFRLQTGLTEDRTADHFVKSIPTIRKALRIAKAKHGIDATGKQVSKRTRKHWAREHALEVAEFLKQPEVLVKDAMEKFQKTERTITSARRFAAQLLQAEGGFNPAADRRKRRGPGSSNFAPPDADPFDGGESAT